MEVKESKTDDKKWEEMRRYVKKLQKENLANYQLEKERGGLKTFDELPSDIQGFLQGKNDEMLIDSW